MEEADTKYIISELERRVTLLEDILTYIITYFERRATEAEELAKKLREARVSLIYSKYGY